MRPVAAVLLAFALLAAPGIPAAPLTGDQDDAGTGSDAGDSQAGATPIVFGEPLSGRLEPAAFGYAGDAEDWYSFKVGAGTRVHVDLAATPGPSVGASTPYWQLVAPDGRVASTGWAMLDWPFVAHVDGVWAVRVFAWDAAWDYDLRVFGEPAGLAASRVGTGWLLVSVSLGEGAWAIGNVTTNILQFEHTPGEVCEAVMDAVWISSGCGSIESYAPSPAVQAGDVRTSWGIPLEGGAGMGSWWHTGARGPGVAHFLAFGNASEVSAAVELQLHGNASVLDIRSGGAEDVFAYRRADFKDGVGASSGGLGVSSGLRADVTVEGTLVARAECGDIGTCSVVRPDGSTASFAREWQTFAGVPGAWTFVRDREASTRALLSGGDGNVVFGADIRFP